MVKHLVQFYKERERIVERQVHQLACREKSIQLIQYKAYPSVLLALKNIVINGRSPFGLRPFLFVYYQSQNNSPVSVYPKCPKTASSKRSLHDIILAQ